MKQPLRAMDGRQHIVWSYCFPSHLRRRRTRDNDHIDLQLEEFLGEFWQA